MYVPSVIETFNSGRHSKVIDLFSNLYKNRVIYLNGELTDEDADLVIMQLMCLDQSSSDDISLYINSPGGSVYAGFAIRDCMERINSKVNTIGIGSCLSMGCYLVAAGTGVRKCTRRTRFLVHSVYSKIEGAANDLASRYDESRKCLENVKQDMLSFSKGKMSYEDISKLTEYDHCFGFEDAIEFGIIDEVL